MLCKKLIRGSNAAVPFKSNMLLCLDDYDELYRCRFYETLISAS
jgi:hypothetical protein